MLQPMVGNACLAGGRHVVTYPWTTKDSEQNRDIDAVPRESTMRNIKHESAGHMTQDEKPSQLKSQ
jgi:hypothetical protein